MLKQLCEQDKAKTQLKTVSSSSFNKVQQLVLEYITADFSKLFQGL